MCAAALVDDRVTRRVPMYDGAETGDGRFSIVRLPVVSGIDGACRANLRVEDRV